MPPIRPVRSHTAPDVLLQTERAMPFANLTNLNSSTVTGNSLEPRTRRKITPEQLLVLDALYAECTHPDRRTRQECADRCGMDLKAVTIWLQNKRQAVKKAIATSAPAHNPIPPRPSAKQLRRTVSTPHTSVSLDLFANRGSTARRARVVSESSGVLSANQVPKTILHHHEEDEDETDRIRRLWERMPSSPQDPSSSPTIAFTELERVSSKRGLEWACARDRIVHRPDKDVSPVPSLSESGSEETETAEDDDEVQTPKLEPSAGTFAVVHAADDDTYEIASLGEDSAVSTSTKKAAVDVRSENEAASILLMFKTQSRS